MQPSRFIPLRGPQAERFALVAGSLLLASYDSEQEARQAADDAADNGWPGCRIIALVPLERRRAQQLNILADALSIVLAALQQDAIDNRVEVSCLKLSAPHCIADLRRVAALLGG